MPKRTSMSQAEREEANETLPPLDPIIEALLSHLPASGEVFAPDVRELWLKIFTLSLQLIYLDKEPEGGQPETD